LAHLDQEQQTERTLPSARGSVLKRYLQTHRFNLGLIAIVAWVANYLHFTSFGLYEDDWFFVGFPFLVSARDWLIGSLSDQFKAPNYQGRPLQMIFGYLFAEAGALTKSLALDYLIAYALFLGSAILVYEVLRRRFPLLLSTLAALIFVLTPLDTLHQFLNGQFSFGPAFILLFCAFLLYRQRRFVWSYILAVLSLLCYESIFFLFLGAPLLENAGAFRGRGREWLRHLGILGALVAGYFVSRRLVGETRVSGLPGGGALVVSVVYAAAFHTVASFATYLYAALRAHEAQVEGWFYAAVFAAAIAGLFRRDGRHKDTAESESSEPVWQRLWPVAVGAIFLILGYVVSYFFFKETEPHLHFTDRDSRISVAASFGSSLIFAALLYAWIAIAKSRVARAVAYTGAGAFLLMLFLYSFVLQQDYVADWREQGLEAAQVMTLTPDVQRDSIIVLRQQFPGLPFFTSGRRRRAIGFEKTLYEWEFPDLYATGQPWPHLFIVYSDAWPHYLKQDPNGLMHFTSPTFDGRWYPATGDYRYRPGRFIVLEEAEPGWIVRHNDPIFADGQQIVQQQTAGPPEVPLWTSMRVTALSEDFLPSFPWKSTSPEPVRLGVDTALTRSPVVFSWPPVAGAEDYWIDVGNSRAKGDIYAAYTGGKTQATLSLADQIDGRTIHVQVYPKFPGVSLVPGTGAQYTLHTPSR
jgi:hypothetical protein